MPSTRSRGRVQPTLHFPRRKSCRVSSLSKTPQPKKSPESSPTKSEPQHLAPNMTRIGPLSPRRPTDRPSLMSPRRPSPISPSLQPRLPLSPRKRTGKRLQAGKVKNVGRILGDFQYFRSTVDIKIYKVHHRCMRTSIPGK